MLFHREFKDCLSNVVVLLTWKDVKNLAALSKQANAQMKRYISRDMYITFKFKEYQMRNFWRNNVNYMLSKLFPKKHRIPVTKRLTDERIPKRVIHVIQNIIIYCENYTEGKVCEMYIQVGDYGGISCPLIYAPCSRIEKLGKTFVLYFFLDTYFYNWHSSPFHPYTVKLKYEDEALENTLPFEKMLVTGFMGDDEWYRKIGMNWDWGNFLVPNKTKYGWDVCYYEDRGANFTMASVYEKGSRGNLENGLGRKINPRIVAKCCLDKKL